MLVHTPVRSAFTVAGITCRHCAQVVCDEVGGIHGVHAVDVVMATGAVTVTADRVIGPDEVTAALHVAGYELVG